MKNIIELVRLKQNKIHDWLHAYEDKTELPIYSSVDIRDSGFKMAVVDTNLFPAGFNNLCEHGLADSVQFMRETILKRVPVCRNILIIAEEHTRNTWYLENLRILQDIIRQAGFETTVATFLSVQPAFCEDVDFVSLQTATGQSIHIHCFKKLLDKIKDGQVHFDLVILNNDLTTGIPEPLRQMNAPIYPSLLAGWHSRLKSHHFTHSAELLTEFADILGEDPWLFSTINTVVPDVNINDVGSRQRLMDAGLQVLEKIKTKYTEHEIDEKPYLVVKADSGTYGMGVMTIEEPDELLTLGRRSRNRLYKGKGAQVIDRFLVQEGIPTIYNIDQQVSEVVIYQINNNLVGGFYRSHGEKSRRENLNAKGMDFKKMCPHLSKYGDCGVHHDINIFDIYRILARIAGIAAHREIVQLETSQA